MAHVFPFYSPPPDHCTNQLLLYSENKMFGLSHISLCGMPIYHLFRIHSNFQFHMNCITDTVASKVRDESASSSRSILNMLYNISYKSCQQYPVEASRMQCKFSHILHQLLTEDTNILFGTIFIMWYFITPFVRNANNVHEIQILVRNSNYSIVENVTPYFSLRRNSL